MQDTPDIASAALAAARPAVPSQGRVTAVRGPVVDVAVTGPPPAIHDALTIAGPHGPIAAEVQAHLDEAHVRAIALQSTQGLARGAAAAFPGGPITVPVGRACWDGC